MYTITEEKRLKVTKNKFLALTLLIIPYCNYNRGPSTKYSESVHICNSNLNVVLNLWYDCFTSEITISLYDGRKTTLAERLKNVVTRNKNINNNDINKICEKYL